MVAKVYSVATIGLEGQIIEIETDISNSLPGITIVGLGDKAVDEARERIRSALKNSGFPLTPKRFTVNLVPADLPKKGSSYDLPIALSLLLTCGQLETVPQDSLFLGELGLNGELKPIGSVLAAVETAKRNGYKQVFLSRASTRHNLLIEGVQVYPMDNLRQLIRHLLDEDPVQPLRQVTSPAKPRRIEHDMADIYGQESAKRALIIAVAGRHNILLSGPPGAGKTMLARAAGGLLPALDLSERIEVTKIHQLSAGDCEIIADPPFRSPHHTASNVALIGGGTWPKPGEISLAHRGVLFLDEIAEFPRSVLEVLRQPLEEGTVRIARANGHLLFPARFMLIASQNPCPCGFAGDPQQTCSCSVAQITNYRRKLSGPLLDRIDMFVTVQRPNQDQLLAQQVGLSTTQMRAEIAKAQRIQQIRNDSSNFYNSQVSSSTIRDLCKLSAEAETVAAAAVANLLLSARAFHGVLRVARTIADLQASESVTAAHLTEAIQYRQR